MPFLSPNQQCQSTEGKWGHGVTWNNLQRNRAVKQKPKIVGAVALMRMTNVLYWVVVVDEGSLAIRRGGVAWQLRSVQVSPR